MKQPHPSSSWFLVSLVLALFTLHSVAPAEARRGRKKNKKAAKILPVGPSWTPPPVVPVTRTPGSIWSSNTRGIADDHRARHLNDIVTIRITERSVAKSGVKTSTSRTQNSDLGIPNFFGLMESLAGGDLVPSTLVQSEAENTFDGDGSTQRDESLTTTVTGRVVLVLPNGNLHVEAAREVKINNERQYLLVGGVVRPHDVATDNSITSTQMADLRIVFAGAGDLSKVQKKGWFLKALSWLLPF